MFDNEDFFYLNVFMCWSCGTELCVPWEGLYKHSVLLLTHMLHTLRCKNVHFFRKRKELNCMKTNRQTNQFVFLLSLNGFAPVRSVELNCHHESRNNKEKACLSHFN